MKAWRGVDLDGCLAFYDGWKGPFHIGEPIPEMVAVVRDLLRQGDVKIFTARVSGGDAGLIGEITECIQNWLENKAGLPRLEVTCVKDFGCLEIYDDRCVQVIPNTGRLVRDRSPWG